MQQMQPTHPWQKMLCLLLLQSGDFEKRLEQKTCTASHPDASHSFQHEEDVCFAQESQYCGGSKEREIIGLVFLMASGIPTVAEARADVAGAMVVDVGHKQLWRTKEAPGE